MPFWIEIKLENVLQQRIGEVAFVVISAQLEAVRTSCMSEVGSSNAGLHQSLLAMTGAYMGILIMV